MAGEIPENFNGHVFQDGRCLSIEDVDTIYEEVVSKHGEIILKEPHDRPTTVHPSARRRLYGIRDGLQGDGGFLRG